MDSSWLSKIDHIWPAIGNELYPIEQMAGRPWQDDYGRHARRLQRRCEIMIILIIVLILLFGGGGGYYGYGRWGVGGGAGIGIGTVLVILVVCYLLGVFH